MTRGSERPPSDVRADREDAEFVSISGPSAAAALHAVEPVLRREIEEGRKVRVL